MAIDPNLNKPEKQATEITPRGAKRAWINPIAFVFAILLVPLLPFLLFADRINASAQDWLNQFSANPAALATAGFLLLTSDILLPIPSSLVCTWLGQMLGWWRGAAVGWAGLTCGNVIGLLLARMLGFWFVARIADAKSLAQYETWAKRYGVWLIVLSRPLPLVSEAVLLGLGIASKLRWHWIGVVVLCNLIIAILWTALGVAGQLASMEWMANVLSVAIPVALLYLWRYTHPVNQ
jgi:uncharacterized membrane protein YdjX (TVP38/TMEM64 family)